MNRKNIISSLIFIILVIVIIFSGTIYYNGKVEDQQVLNNEEISDNKPDESKPKNITTNIYGNFGPYNFDNLKQEVTVSVSDNNWGVVFQNMGKYHIVIKNKEKNVIDSKIFDFKVSDSFYTYRYQKNNKWYVRMNNNEYGPFDDNIRTLISNNYWAIQYFDEEAQHDKAIVNGKIYNDYVSKITISDNYYGVVYGIKSEMKSFIVINNNKYGPYPFSGTNLDINNNGWLIHYTKGPHNSYVLVGDKEFSLDLGDSYLENCTIYNFDRWGCEYPDEKNWLVLIYENNNKKIYGPYGNFSDPRESVQFLITNRGFIFNTSYKQLVINNNGAETKISESNIYSIQDNENLIGYAYVKDNNHYININEKNYGPYKNIYNFLITKNGWGFNYLKNNSIVAFVNEVVYEKAIGNISISNNNYGIAYEKDENLYVKIGKN